MFSPVNCIAYVFFGINDFRNRTIGSEYDSWVTWAYPPYWKDSTPAPTIGPQTYPANYTGATTQFTTTVFTGNDHLYDAYALWFTLITGFNVIVAPLWGLLADWMVKFLVTCGHTFQKAQMGMVCFMYVLVAIFQIIMSALATIKYNWVAPYFQDAMIGLSAGIFYSMKNLIIIASTPPQFVSRCLGFYWGFLFFLKKVSV